MPKINVRGIDKKALVNRIFVTLNAIDPEMAIPGDMGMESIAKAAWGFNCSDASEVFDDTQFVEMHKDSHGAAIAGLVQMLADDLRAEKAKAEYLEKMKAAAQGRQAPKAEQKRQQDKPAASAAAPAAFDPKLASEMDLLDDPRLIAEQKKLWEDHQRSADAARQAAASLESARKIREAIEQENARRQQKPQLKPHDYKLRI